jgi:hypothetical protein
MPVTLQTNGRNAAADAVTALVNGGKLVLKAANDTVLCTVTLNNPAFGAASSGSAALSVSPALSGTGSAGAGGGTLATKFDFTTSADAVVWSGEVVQGSASDGQIGMDNNSIAEDQVVNVTGYTHTQPA